jgi:alanyl-tRNA synthetase
MITFDKDYSVELCGGCHVPATGHIGLFKITAESAVAAGVRRIEAVTSIAAENYINKELAELNSIRELFKNPVNTTKNVAAVQEENKNLKKQLEEMITAQANHLQADLKKEFIEQDDACFLIKKLELNDTGAVKTLAYNLVKNQPNSFVAFGFEKDAKAQIMVVIDEKLSAKFHAGNIIREVSKFIQGGGGGQAFFATAGGKNPSGINDALDAIRTIVNL